MLQKFTFFVVTAALKRFINHLQLEKKLGQISRKTLKAAAKCNHCLMLLSFKGPIF